MIKKTIYKVVTQEEYDRVMKELEKEGNHWFSGHKPTKLNYFKEYNEGLAIYVDADGAITKGPASDIRETKGWSIVDGGNKQQIYPLAHGCVGIDAPDFETARRMFSDYMSKLDTSLYGIVNPKVYTIRVEDNKTTVITPDGKCATAKCHPDDDFDVVEGFRVAIEKIEEQNRKLTDKEKAILNALKLLNVDEFYVRDDALKGYTDDGDITLSIDEDDFKWCEEYEEYAVKELLEKYA